MNEHSQQQGISNGSPDEPEMVVLIKKLQQHLVFLEKKIDILIGRSSHKPFKENRFSKPIRSGGHSHRRVWTEGGNHSSERNLGRSGPFDQSHGGGGHGFSHGKKRPFRHKKSWQ